MRVDPEPHREQIVCRVRGQWGAGLGERRLQHSWMGVIPRVGPMLLWTDGGDCRRMGQGKEEDVGGHRVGTGDRSWERVGRVAVTYRVRQ